MSSVQPAGADRDNIILIGPPGVGKSTVAPLLGSALGMPVLELDDLRWAYYAEIGYDPSYAQQLVDTEGLPALSAYWKPYEIHAVERVLRSYQGHVIAFGAGHSFYVDPVLLQRAQHALAPCRHVILLEPSPDIDTSIATGLCRARPRPAPSCGRLMAGMPHIACEVPPEPLPPTGKAVGVDMGLESFATLSDGTRIPNPRLYHAAERKLKRAQRRISRRVKGSNRRRKARELLAKAHLKIQRARLDFAHKTAHAFVTKYDQIVVEKLNIKGMVRNHPLAKSISDAGWGLFVNVLRAKAASAGRVVLEVNPADTSQTCAQCGEHVPKRLAVRWHSCPYCGCELHRDHNAALNILQKGGGTAFGEALPLGGPKNREPGTL
jgi:IS605 OrfB family transposase